MASTTPSQAPERAAAPIPENSGHNSCPSPISATEAEPGNWSAGTQEEHRGAFEALFERYHARIYEYIARLLGSAEDAADVTQDVFLKAYRKLPETVGRGGFRPEAWLYRIATNACLDAIRHRRLVAFCSLDRLMPWRTHRGTTWLLEAAAPYLMTGQAPAGEGAHEVADPGGWGDPQQLTLEHERAEHVQAALERLRAQHRSVLLLREYHDLSYDEIAEVLSTTRSGVKSLLFRAREEFRQVWPRVAPDAGEAVHRR